MARTKGFAPCDYQITDAIRDWSETKFGTPHLPDVYREDWVDAAIARGSTYADCERALMNWVRWSSPAGKFYRAQDWEAKLKAAKRMGQPVRLVKPAQYTPIGPTEPMPEHFRVAGRAALAAIKGKLG